MKKLEGFVSKVSRLFDNIAGWGIAAVMILVIANILLRTVFNSPIQGVYEYVGYITAVVIGFGLAWCAVQKSHIAIEFIMEKLPHKIQLVINTATGIMVFVFLLFTSMQVFRQGFKVIASGEVSATSQIPFYPFIFLVALGFLSLCMVELVNVLKGVTQK